MIETKLYDLETDPFEASIAEAGKVIARGGIVVFPTETVYGLGADAMNAGAVAKIFEAKGRPGDNPLIVHVSDLAQVETLVKAVPEKAKRLAEAFWPGPLTLIMARSDRVPDRVTAGLSTVAVRYPSHPAARALIDAAGTPIAAPSANISGRPSPTKSTHVLEDMIGKVDAILIDADTEVGLESTVMDMTSEPPTMLRPGGITAGQIEAVIGKINLSPNITQNVIPEKAKSPGMKYKHYAPKGAMVIVRGSDAEKAAKITSAIKGLPLDARPAILATDETMGLYRRGLIVSLGSRDDPESMSHNLFARLREFDAMGVTHIFAEEIAMSDATMALNNRMYKAAGYTFI